MPFKSEAQRRFLWARHPEIAKKFAHHRMEPQQQTPRTTADSMSEGRMKVDVSGDRRAKRRSVLKKMVRKYR